MKIKLTDLKIDKTKERGQIHSINHEDAAKKVAGYQSLPPPGPLRVTAPEDTGMTRFAFLHKVDNISSPCCAVVHDLRCRWLALRSDTGQKHAERFRTCGLQKAKNWRTCKNIAMLTFSSKKRVGGSGPRMQDCIKLAAGL